MKTPTARPLIPDRLARRLADIDRAIVRAGGAGGVVEQLLADIVASVREGRADLDLLVGGEDADVDALVDDLAALATRWSREDARLN